VTGRAYPQKRKGKWVLIILLGGGRPIVKIKIAGRKGFVFGGQTNESLV
jgi:hypothetical protein